MIQNPCPNSINKTRSLHLDRCTYPGDEFASYFLPAQEVAESLSAGEIPLISLKEELKDKRPVIAVILAQDKSPEREEKDYSIHPDYVRAVVEAGGCPVFIAYDKVKEQLDAWKPQGILLIGGSFNSPKEWYTVAVEADIDKRGDAYLQMLNYAQNHKLPVLGICGGEQMLAGRAGAKLAKGIANHKIGGEKVAHKVKIVPGSLLAEIVAETEIFTNSAHSEAVIAEQCGNCKVTALAEDGTVEAIELKKPWHRFILGVQWHPERLVKKDDKAALNIFKRFIESAAGQK